MLTFSTDVFSGEGCSPFQPAFTPREPTTRPGDLWILGEHRLLCGDSRDAAQVRRLMADERATLMATDPPYLVDYDGGNHPRPGADGRRISSAAKTKHWDTYVDPTDLG